MVSSPDFHEISDAEISFYWAQAKKEIERAGGVVTLILEIATCKKLLATSHREYTGIFQENTCTSTRATAFYAALLSTRNNPVSTNDPHTGH